jgi:hypothetical protein
VQINPGSVTGHLAASGLFPADVAMLNSEIGAFIEKGQSQVKRSDAPSSAPSYDAGGPGGPIAPTRPPSTRPPRR